MKKDIVKAGDRFGKLVIKKEVSTNKYTPRTYVRRFLCVCDCGNETIVSYPYLKNGRIKSCGCWRKTKRPRKYFDSEGNSRLYTIWNAMKERCYCVIGRVISGIYPNSITIYLEWLDKEDEND